MPYEQISLRPPELRNARVAVRHRLADLACDNSHIEAVECVVGELLGVVEDAGEHNAIALSVESFPLLTSVRVRCPAGSTWRDDPFGLRERILRRLTIAVGQRRHADGSFELWAEIPRRTDANFR